MSNNTVFKLPPVIAELRAAQQEVVRHYAHTELTFTLDGKLVGDIGEAIALEYFDVEQERNRQGKLMRRKGIDAVVRGERATVQIKATGGTRTGPAFSRGDTPADLLLFLRIDWQACTATVIYNGPEAPIRACLGMPTGQGTVSVRLNEVLRIGSTITDPRMRVPLRSCP